MPARRHRESERNRATSYGLRRWYCHFKRRGKNKTKCREVSGLGGAQGYAGLASKARACWSYVRLPVAIWSWLLQMQGSNREKRSSSTLLMSTASAQKVHWYADMRKGCGSKGKRLFGLSLTGRGRGLVADRRQQFRGRAQSNQVETEACIELGNRVGREASERSYQPDENSREDNQEWWVGLRSNDQENGTECESRSERVHQGTEDIGSDQSRSSEAGVLRWRWEQPGYRWCSGILTKQLTRASLIGLILIGIILTSGRADGVVGYESGDISYQSQGSFLFGEVGILSRVSHRLCVRADSYVSRNNIGVDDGAIRLSGLYARSTLFSTNAWHGTRCCDRESTQLMSTVFRPHPGPQEDFLATSADIAIYGGAAGGGKTVGLLMESTRHINVPNFSAVFFRRTYPELKNPGGLWDESQTIYRGLRGRPRGDDLSWKWHNGAVVKMSHLQYEDSVYAWQGSQVPLFCFDELTHFTRRQFFYMFSRNRTTCGVRPYIRAGTNPDPDSFVRELIDWWIGSDGFPIQERCGVLRYMAREGDDIIWSDTREELERLGKRPRSFTFIAAKLQDNHTLMKKDPDYLSNLRALPSIERQRLEEGNWDVKMRSGDFFQKSWFPVHPSSSDAPMRSVRFWDRAATEVSKSKDKKKRKNVDPDWTVGLRLDEIMKGRFIITDIERFRATPGETKRRIKNTTEQDGRGVTVGLEQEPGASGKSEVADLVKELGGFKIKVVRPTGSKVERAKPVSAQCEYGNIGVVRARWNRAFFDEAEGFPNECAHDDQVDGLSGAYDIMSGRKKYGARDI